MLTRILLLLLVALSTACSTVAPKSIVELAPEINATYKARQFRVRPGDSIQVTFSEKEGWNHSAIVQPDGSASFLKLDQIHVQGKSLTEIDDMLTQAYAKKVTDYDLTVSLAEHAAPEVQVFGAVNADSALTLTGENLHLLEALARAGGQDEAEANLGNVLLVRQTSPFAPPISWRLDARVRHWTWADPIQLMPGDLIYIPERRIVRVNRFVDQFIRRLIPLPRLITLN